MRTAVYIVDEECMGFMWDKVFSLTSDCLFAVISGTLVVKRSWQPVNTWKEQNTQFKPNRSIARPIPCVCWVNDAQGTFDSSREDKLDDPSCGDAMRTDGKAAAAEATTVVAGVSGWFLMQCDCL